jgi:hypothetical protein
VDTAGFDALVKGVAVGGTRRRFVRGLAALGLGGMLLRPARGRAATRAQCEAVKCPQGYTRACNYDARGECLGCYCIKPTSGGIVGGGVVRAEDGGEAHLSLLATRTPDASEPDVFNVVGQVKLTIPNWEGSELTLDATQITGYGPTPDVEGGRDVYGWMQASAVDSVVPFFLQVIDAGGPGSGKDTVHLLVGDSVPPEAVLNATAETIGFSYTIQGRVEGGDLALVEFGTEGESVPGTPTA